jgi:MarR family transcriptional regulator, 2-MHQ and catechol-resistance regulon repressor
MDKDSIGIQVFSALRKSANTIRSEVYKKLLARDLTLRQFMVLEALCREGPVSIGELAGEISASRETAGKVVTDLEKRNLVARRRDDQDHYVVALTTQGGKLINTLFPAHIQIVEQVMGKLTDAEQEHLKRLCDRFEPAAKGV